MVDDTTYDGLIEFRDRRLSHEAARKYAVTVDGVEHNAGEFRDNTADVLEELSDAHNIAMIGLKRAMADPTVQRDPYLIGAYAQFVLEIEDLMQKAMGIRNMLPDYLKEDQADILGDKTPSRIVTLAEVGL